MYEVAALFFQYLDMDEILRDMDGSQKPEELSPEQMEAMLMAEERIKRKFPRKIEADGHTYKVRQISKGIRARIHALEIEAFALSGRQKEKLSARQAKRIQRKLDRLHVKTAAYYLLGNRARIPGLFWLTWRRLMWRSEKAIAMINNAAVNDEEINFSSANWDITEIQLALSMRPIGDGVRRTLKRWESASQQVKEDATRRKEEEPKSGASSPKAPRMRK